MKIIEIYRHPHTKQQFRLIDRDGFWTICKWTKAGWRKVPNTTGSALEWKARQEIEEYAWKNSLIHCKIPEMFVKV